MHSILTCYSNSANYTGAWGKAPPYETNKNELHSSAMDKQQRHVKCWLNCYGATDWEIPMHFTLHNQAYSTLINLSFIDLITDIKY